MLICHRLRYKLKEEVDLSGIVSYFKFVLAKKCKVEIDIIGRVLSIKLCCPSRKYVADAKARLNLVEGIERAVLPSLGFPKAFKLTYFKDKGICLGKDDRGAPLCLPRKWLERHVLIVGSTGSGKSTTAHKLFSELEDSKVMLDWHGEHDWPNRISCVNLNKLDRLSNVEILDALGSSLSLSDAQYYLLLKVLQLLRTQKRTFGIRDIIFYVKSLEETSRWMRESKFSLLRKLEMLVHKGVCKHDLTEIPYMSENGLVIDLSGYTEYGKRFVANVVIAYLFTQARAGMKKTFVFVEEAHNVVSKGDEGIVDKAFMEGRKYGLHLIAITQSPKSASPNIIKNTGLKVIHMLREVEDAKYMAESIGYPELWKEFISLEVGEAIIAFRKPLRVFIDSKKRTSSFHPSSKSTPCKGASRT